MDAIETIPAAPAAEFSGKSGDLMADLALLAKETGTVAPAVEAVEPAAPEPTQPETTTPATAPATVPDKFKDAAGNLDPAKVEKSTQDAEAALTKYLAKEKELRQKMNEVSKLGQAAPAAPGQAPTPGQPLPFAQQLEADMKQYGAGAVLERLFEAAKETAKREVLSDVQAFREEREDQKSREELKDILKNDPDLVSRGGLDALARIRAERPYLNSAPNPTSAAYEVYLAEQVKSQRLGQQVQPNPKGTTAKAPPTPVGPAARVVVNSPTNTTGKTTEEINAMTKGMTAQQEAAFWKSKGLKF